MTQPAQAASERTGRRPLLLSWSSGKDSAWTLHVLRDDPRFEVVGLVTTVNETHGRVAMHAVRERLLELQAASAGLPLRVVRIPAHCSNEAYEAALGRELRAAVAEGVEAIAFGDLFLADVRAYRERTVGALGLEPVFPLWGRDTRELAQEMIAGGLRARITCVDPRVCPRELAGAEFDEELLARLPAGVDPCGENGEFHTFAWAGPQLRTPLEVELGPIVERDGFVFADLVPRGDGERDER